MEISTEVNRNNYMSLEEAAIELGCTKNALGKFLNKHKEIKNEYVFKNFADGRKKWCIALDGLTVVANVKDTDRTKKESNALILEDKQKIAETAIVSS